MARVSPCLWAMVLVVATTFQLQVVAALRVGYYAQTCPNAEAIVGNAMARHMQVDSGTAPGVLRLHFHDCFVDVSIDNRHSTHPWRMRIGVLLINSVAEHGIV